MCGCLSPSKGVATAPSEKASPAPTGGGRAGPPVARRTGFWRNKHFLLPQNPALSTAGAIPLEATSPSPPFYSYGN